MRNFVALVSLLGWLASGELEPQSRDDSQTQGRGGELRVVGAGLGRTGTDSLRHALDALGYRCYHAQEMQRLGHGPMWAAAARAARAGDVESEATIVLRIAETLVELGFDAAVDFPVASVWPLLARRWPQAKVILSVREDRAAWARSYRATIGKPPLTPTAHELHPWFTQRAGLRLDHTFAQTLAAGERWDTSVRAAFGDGNVPPPSTSELSELSEPSGPLNEREHEQGAGGIDSVGSIGVMPPWRARESEFARGRLLVHDGARDGWPPLCAFVASPHWDHRLPQHEVEVTEVTEVTEGGGSTPSTSASASASARCPSHEPYPHKNARRVYELSYTWLDTRMLMTAMAAGWQRMTTLVKTGDDGTEHVYLKHNQATLGHSRGPVSRKWIAGIARFAAAAWLAAPFLVLRWFFVNRQRHRAGERSSPAKTQHDHDGDHHDLSAAATPSSTAGGRRRGRHSKKN